MLYEMCRLFPPLPVRFPESKRLALLGIEPQRYAAMALALSLAAFIAALAFSKSALFAAAAAAGAAAIVIVLPKLEMARRAADIESELPLFLRSLGMLMEFGMPFQRALECAARGCGALEEEIGRCCLEMRRGMAAQKALSMLALGYDSMALKRAVSALAISFESGAGGAEIRKIGDDMLSLERFRLREYASKSAIFGLVLIVTGAILPTFFLVYFVAGPSSGLGDAEMRIAMLVVFPMCSLLAILLSRSMMPRMVFGNSGLSLLSMAPGAIVVAGDLLMPKFQLAFLAAGVGAGAYALYRTFAAESRLEDIERRLPDALFSAGGMPKSSSAERLFRMIAEGGFGALSAEAAKSLRQISANVPPPAALEDLWQRNRSPMLRRACMMLRSMMDTNSLDRIGMLADDMIKSAQLKRERASVFSMQKYTLLAGALFIPLILKMALSLLSGMGDLLGGGAAAKIASAGAIAPAYLVAYSVISSAAIGDYEGKKSAAVIYLAAMGIISLLAFRFISF
ncbi:MAG TPA: type II secretion system F family protein [Candidatus Bilamarchaeum sp.]|nr:type II secretion system F family protein [Candidatus Bilamarchaeum sp.]